MPIQRAREPTAQSAPRGKLGAVERARERRGAAVPEAGVGLVDLEAARDHAGEHQNRRPMGQADDPMVAADRCLPGDRKSTRLNSSHGYISYAVFCLKK